ncbi:MAG: lipoyl(octanoyl) transferase LipB [Proteobacteria bacterium]|nr:lipoyl(octanoyl) transferase LipB [Pseudomonadota bacterium]
MRVVDLGLMAYGEAEALQLAALAEVLAGGAQTLFLVEHPRVITLGRQGGQENLHVSAAFLQSQGIELAQTKRGGNITCHFPGQLVAYPIFRVDRRQGGIRQFFADMEEAVIRTCVHFGVAAERRPGYPGVWTSCQAGGQSKLCSMGIGVKRGVTYHGLALNVGPDVSLFELITLCGIDGAAPTSLARQAAKGAVASAIEMKEVKDVLTREFRARFAHPPLA